MKKLLIAACLILLLSSCEPHSYFEGFFSTWHKSCPGFPPLEQTETTLEEHSAFFESLEEKGLIYHPSIGTCPEGSYIMLYHGGQSQIEPVLKAMDEINARAKGQYFFFDIPFRFVNV